ncbi:hypothetical protein H5410_049652, partial [Solanum commersonii]
DRNSIPPPIIFSDDFYLKSLKSQNPNFSRSTFWIASLSCFSKFLLRPAADHFRLFSVHLIKPAAGHLRFISDLLRSTGGHLRRSLPFLLLFESFPFSFGFA